MSYQSKQVGIYNTFSQIEEYKWEKSGISDELLCKHFNSLVTFGTAGLRAKMSFGTFYINYATILITTQAVCEYYLNKLTLDACQNSCVIIGYDGRRNSRYYAALTGAVFTSKNIKIRIADTYTPTPLTPFCIKQYNAICGIQITASHNPKDDNGYKLYDGNGAQINSNVALEISNLREKQTQPWPNIYEQLDHIKQWFNPKSAKAEYITNSLLNDWACYAEIVKSYLMIDTFEHASVSIVYSAVHGVGYGYVYDILINKLKLDVKKFNSVVEQQLPDEEFSTLKYPNPEEKGVPNLSIEYAKKSNSPIIVINDPDADRLLVLEKDTNNNYYQFSGDEIGILLYYVLVEKFKNSIPNKCVTNSIVSTKLFEAIAKNDNIKYIESSTGFKWLANNLLDDQLNNNTFPFYAYEEALGYGVMISKLPDKDGISALALLLDKAFKLYNKNFTIKEFLFSKLAKISYFSAINSYFICDDTKKIKQFFDNFRKNGYPNELCNMKIKRILDLANGFDNSQKENKCKINCKTDDILSIEFKNDSRITIRGSGTEPKLKYYSEAYSLVSLEDAQNKIKNTTNKLLTTLFTDFN